MCKLTKALVFTGVILSLSGCGMILPATHSPIVDTEVRGENVDFEKVVDAYLITPQLVKQLAPRAVKASDNIGLEQQIKRYQYKIGVGDILNVTVWDHPELTTPAGAYRSAAESGNQVHANGTIFYPYVGKVEVVGLTVNQVRDKLAKQLSAYVTDPQIEVTVAAYQSKKAYVTGEIKNPGQQFLTNVPLTLLDAVNKAGGLSENADWHNVTITRHGKEEKVSLAELIQFGNLTQNRLLSDGDVVHIPRNDANKVFIVGEVSKPQMLKITHYGMTLTEAIAQSGGIDKLSADATGIFVIRGQRDVNKSTVSNEAEKTDKIADIYQLDLTNATSYVLGTEFYLKPYDIVYVTTAPATRWNRVIAHVVPSLSGFNNLTESILRVRNW
ncbi:polysaccharide export protein [Glaesserella parasuis]|uniref:polysaccharide export protein n=1 Tax=Glaesserella parasuis TaxID=738 RepID=UPI0004E83FA5|nr:polysaccharide export protein [Glaesserella parasuis]AIK17344.1 sugar transporter [Glaesserella parasuis]MCT8557129.1 polysaccharide export protein [Glaesserella parasuis]MCT8782140.1 polysaccharide export protein [Glaesserella parasuis]MCT8821109.1 polysaccharide export protein [Glaesserella parasuis]MDG6291917.1 polysaccharide export protein [Glaesserella parasuis]